MMMKMTMIIGIGGDGGSDDDNNEGDYDDCDDDDGLVQTDGVGDNNQSVFFSGMLRGACFRGP